MEWRKDNYLVSDDPNKLNVKVIHDFLASAYWAEGRTFETVEKSLQNSFCLGLYDHDKLIGLARTVSDFATIAYLCDVFVLPDHQRQGLGHFLMECLFKHPRVSSLKWLLKTKSAQNLYRDFGFKDFESSFGWMIRN